MADKEKDLAIIIYNTLCKVLNEKNWKFMSDDRKLEVKFTIESNGLPIQFDIAINVEKQLAILYSILTFKMKEEKRIEGALAACIASYNLYDGNFDYNLTDGTLLFRLVFSFKESLISEHLFWKVIRYTCSIVNKYNDKFYSINEGLLSIEDFLLSREGDNNSNN